MRKLKQIYFLLFLLLHKKIMRQIIRSFQSGRAYLPSYSGFGNGSNGPNGPGRGPEIAFTIIFIMGTYFATKCK
jgi:hypothetical protein